VVCQRLTPPAKKGDEKEMEDDAMQVKEEGK